MEEVKLTDGEQALLNSEQAKLQEASRMAEAAYLANRVAELTVENHRLRLRLAEYDLPSTGEA